MHKIHEDAKGLYVKAGGYVARPGPTRGESHVYRMDDGGLEEGETVKARHIPGTQLTRLTLPNGKKLYWHHEGESRDRDLHEPGPEDTPENFDANGLRIFK